MTNTQRGWNEGKWPKSSIRWECGKNIDSIEQPVATNNGGAVLGESEIIKQPGLQTWKQPNHSGRLCLNIKNENVCLKQLTHIEEMALLIDPKPVSCLKKRGEKRDSELDCNWKKKPGLDLL